MEEENPLKDFVSVDGLSNVPQEWCAGWRKAVEADPLNLHYWCQYQLSYIYTAQIESWKEVWDEFCEVFSLRRGGPTSIHIVESVLIPVAAAHVRFASDEALQVLDLLSPAQRNANPYTKWLWWYARHFELCRYYQDTTIPISVDPDKAWQGPHFVSPEWGSYKPERYFAIRVVTVGEDAYALYVQSPEDTLGFDNRFGEKVPIPRAFFVSIGRREMASFSTPEDLSSIREGSFGELVEYLIDGETMFRFFLCPPTEPGKSPVILGAREPPLTVREPPPGFSWEEGR